MKLGRNSLIVNSAKHKFFLQNFLNNVIYLPAKTLDVAPTRQTAVFSSDRYLFTISSKLIL